MASSTLSTRNLITVWFARFSITVKLLFFSVTGIQGYRVHLDENGDAQFNLTLMDIRKDSKYSVRSDQDVKSQAPGKLMSCEDDFTCLPSGGRFFF